MLRMATNTNALNTFTLQEPIKMTCLADRPTALTAARDFFQHAIETGQLSVHNVDLQAYVARRTNQSRAVIHGTLDNTGLGTLISQDWYLAHWHKERASNGRAIHRRNNGHLTVAGQSALNFDFPAKRQACERIMSFLPSGGKPRLLTLASSHGNCVQAALRRNPNVEIHNVECRRDILDLWQAHKVRLGVTTADYYCTFQEFVNAPGFVDCGYALINADVMGYACEAMYEYLSVVNRARSAAIVALTTQYLDNFRNHGAFQDALRKKYRGQTDAHAKAIFDWMNNYDMVDRFDYQKDAGTQRMEVFVFEQC